MSVTVVFVGLAALVAVVHCQTEVNQFPADFMLGCASAAYQIEGAWDEDGKGPSIWDYMLHEHPEYATNGDNGDVACDSYHKYAEDVQLLVDINANVYRFSIAWSRILPTGDLDVINQAGIDYYNNLIDLLLENNIQPVVTMYHWDLPQALQYLGGWPNPLMADYFVEYARILFENFGDRVKWWITFNEPSVFVTGYSVIGYMAPSQNSSGIGDYMAVHTIIKAHARVYHLYDEEYRATQNGNVGITLNIDGAVPASDSEEDIAATDRYYQFVAGLYAHPIFSAEGDYPAVVRERVDANSAAEGRPRSRLLTFTQDEIEYIRGTADFFGVNNYNTQNVTSGELGGSPSMFRDQGTISAWSGHSGQGFRLLLNWIASEYPGYPIFVTENGLYSSYTGLNDTERIQYYSSYLTGLLQAINVDGLPVIGYTAWSIMDNLEWNSGFTQKLGLNRVDFDDPDRPRTHKLSSLWMADIYANKELPLEYWGLPAPN